MGIPPDILDIPPFRAKKSVTDTKLGIPIPLAALPLSTTLHSWSMTIGHGTTMMVVVFKILGNPRPLAANPVSPSARRAE